MLPRRDERCQELRPKFRRFLNVRYANCWANCLVTRHFLAYLLSIRVIPGTLEGHIGIVYR